MSSSRVHFSFGPSKTEMFKVGKFDAKDMGKGKTDLSPALTLFALVFYVWIACHIFFESPFPVLD